LLHAVKVDVFRCINFGYPALIIHLGGYIDMINFFSKIYNPDYEKSYKIFKKIPAILSTIDGAAMFVWGFIDAANTSGRYGTYYGILRLPSPILVLLLWWSIGAVLFFLTNFFTKLAIAPTVVRTDAILDVKEKLYRGY
jgi:hypothetical protein